ncbi:HNH endonuclease family protein [Yinghuangia sp. ASG 101]|uniref:HNH endonuclease family protein n=1 Tax=Yinghuangia sp. ASG 101 TaxID=2896848 RepID=UPI001E4B3172|nr:HNH endonuclease family protein [Yinghuangia sp. ASG 101]UGQ09548.1 HNH endonuclease family protein [Yinghuangia sp. ASG 101]
MGRGWGRRLAALAATAALTTTACSALDDTGDSAASGGPTAAAPPAASSGTGPLANTDGTLPGLAPVTADPDRAQARALIGQLRTAGRGPKTGYARDEFGSAWTDSATAVPFGGNGCGTRDDILRRDGTGVRFRSGSTCVVDTMTLVDPYTGTSMTFRKKDATEVQIDHVVALSAAWQMGAAYWPRDKRVQLANDPLNLLAVDGPTNNGKRDATPASWLPPAKQIRCAYVVRYAQVSLKYELPVTEADKAEMLRQCA